MATKKSSKTKRTKANTKITTTPQPYRKTVLEAVSLAIIIVIVSCLIAVSAFIIAPVKTHTESKKLEAFETLARSYIYDHYSEEGVQVADLDNIGLTKDDDLYLDFTVTRYENHTPTSHRKQRIHFQCKDPEQVNIEKADCAMASWIGEWEDVTE